MILHHDSIPSSSKTADPQHCNAPLTACLQMTILSNSAVGVSWPSRPQCAEYGMVSKKWTLDD